MLHRLSPGSVPLLRRFVPERKVTRKARFRKFIYQKADIGNSDI